MMAAQLGQRHIKKNAVVIRCFSIVPIMAVRSAGRRERLCFTDKFESVLAIILFVRTKRRPPTHSRSGFEGWNVG
ncbi:hypothetical protein A9K65_013860 [Mesorhizobium sp. WSM1497]|nr:hypothetical protein A9K65_013860 [Mesorhizobium sp. WSM1497]